MYMNTLLTYIKKVIPERLLNGIRPSYHYMLGYLASFVYKFPSKEILVVGITGTTGKTTSTFLTAKILQHAGLKVGYTSTALFGDGEKEWLNDKKMTMVGRFFTQKMLRKMVKNKCDVAIVETTSEGIVQNRHKFINYDILAFTGLYPEHIESHGSFENYKQAKLELFRHLEVCLHKTIREKKIEKTIIANHDDQYSREFLAHKADNKIEFSTAQYRQQFMSEGHVRVLRAHDVYTNETGVAFMYHNETVQTKLLGEYNVKNIMTAFSIGEALDLTTKQLVEGIASVQGIPGRAEKIDLGQDFTVIVDYAFEPKAMNSLYEIVEKVSHNKVIHVLGGTGGGRDKSRREVIGKIAGERADIVIVTNEDPYDEDPQEIMEMVAKGSEQAGKVRDKDLLFILDRKEAIKKAIHVAQPNDLVLITGKGCEQAICIENGKIISWDDREVAREILAEKI